MNTVSLSEPSQHFAVFTVFIPYSLSKKYVMYLVKIGNRNGSQIFSIIDEVARGNVCVSGPERIGGRRKETEESSEEVTDCAHLFGDDTGGDDY